jgi:glycosyltransferase involved in cell wall biosynthesis
MKILLLGEFSAVHKNLKEGLLELGHEATTASNGDGSRKINSDIYLGSNYSGLLGKLIILTKPLLNLSNFKNFDVVQLINPFVFYSILLPNRQFYNKIFDKNQKFFILAGGDDSYYWKNAREKLRYSPIRDYLKYDLKKESYYLEKKSSLIFNEWLANKCNGIIPNNFDYAEVYKDHPKIRETIPIPINTNKITYKENIIKEKIVIFHGLNSNRKGFKGTRYVEEAFEYLRAKYPNDLELIIKGDMPLNEYLKVMSKVNVVVDQTNGYSCGVNALFAMAMGKVVLSGAEPESLDALGLDKTPAINILPDSKTIISVVERLLADNNKIMDIGQQSRKFVEDVHDYKIVAQKYIDVWTQN